MPAQIQLQKRQSQELKRICRIGSSDISRLVDSLHAAECPLVPKDVQRVFADVLSDEELGEVCQRQFLSLAGLQRQLRLLPADVIAGLDYGIQSFSPAWSGDEYQQWTEVKPAFERMLAEPQLQRASKAIDLAFDYANLLQSARIVTDIRPVFDEDAATICGTVVSFTLRLVFESAGERQSTSVALDCRDVESLAEQCQRALQKAKTAQQIMMSGDRTIRTVISGGGER